MASFFSKILSAFGSGQPSSDAPQKVAQAEPHAHGDYLIYATPIKEGGQFRLAGRIEKRPVTKCWCMNSCAPMSSPAWTMRWSSRSARRNSSSIRTAHHFSQENDDVFLLRTLRFRCLLRPIVSRAFPAKVYSVLRPEMRRTKS